MVCTEQPHGSDYLQIARVWAVSQSALAAAVRHRLVDRHDHNVLYPTEVYV